MEKRSRRRIALFLAVALAFLFAQDIGTVSVFAASDSGLTATRGVYWFSPHEYDYDLTDTFVYDDELLKGDPDLYHPKTLDMEALMQGEFKITDDDAYLPDNYADYIALIEGTLAAAMGNNRAEYSSSHLQDGLRHFVGYFKSHASENSNFAIGTDNELITGGYAGRIIWINQTIRGTANRTSNET